MFRPGYRGILEWLARSYITHCVTCAVPSEPRARKGQTSEWNPGVASPITFLLGVKCTQLLCFTHIRLYGGYRGSMTRKLSLAVSKRWSCSTRFRSISRSVTDAAVPHAQPDHFRGSTPNEAQLTEIGVLGQDRESVFTRVLEDLSVTCVGIETEVAYMFRPRKRLAQIAQQAQGKVLVEQQLHQ